MSLITLDFETVFGDDLSLRKLTYEEYIGDPRFWVYGVGVKIDNNPTQWITFKDANLQEYLTDLLPAGNDHTLVCHNTMFDAAVLVWHYGLTANDYICTMQMSKGLWRYESASLGNLAKRLWPKDQEMRKGNELMVAKNLYKEEEYTAEILGYVGGYCIQDCELTYHALCAMLPHFPTEEIDVIDDVIKMFAHRPITLDEQLVVSYKAELIETREHLIAESGYSIDLLRSAPKFVAAMERDHGIVIKKVKNPTLRNPDNEKYPLAKDDLQFLKLRRERPDLEHIWKAKLAASSNQEITRCDRFLNHGRVSKANPHGNIAIPLNYCGAGTTRFSGTNSINMQNLGQKSKLRAALMAGDGYTFVISDLSSIEGRMNAYHAGADWKLQAYAEGVDFYNDLASDVFGYEVDRKGNPDHKPEGALGKTAELGLGYGMGVSKFQETCHKGPMGEAPMLWVDEEIAQKTVNTWRTKNVEIVNSWKLADNLLEVMAEPNMRPFWWNTVEIHYQGFKLPSGLFVQYPRLRYDKSAFKNDDGSDRWTWQFWNGKFWKDTWGGTVIENIIQAISRVVMTQAEVRAKHRFAEEGIDAILVMQVHDELIFRTRIEDVERTKTIVREELTRTPTWCDPRLSLGCSLDVSAIYIKG